MASKQLNKIVLLLMLTLSIDIFSQMRMIDINGKKLSINLKKEKRNIIKISEDDTYSIFYVLDRKILNLDEKVGTTTLVNIILFSKKYNKGILTVFKQGVQHDKNSVYNIKLYTSHVDENMFIPSMVIVDKDFNYQYLMEYYYMPISPDRNDVYKSWITIQDIKNYCNLTHIDVKGNIIFKNIDNILDDISKINNDIGLKDCNPIISDEDLKYFFPKKISNNFHK